MAFPAWVGATPAADAPTAVLAYVLSSTLTEAPRASPTDGATPLHLVAAGGASGPVAAAHLLLAAGVPVDALAFSGLRAMLNPAWPSSPGSRLKTALAGRELDFDLELLALDQYQQKLLDKVSSPRAS